MKAKMLTYSPIDSPIHRLAGATKLIFFVLWSVTSMITYDTRVLLAMFAFGIMMFVLSKVRFQDYSFVLYLILFFFLLNHAAIFLFSPLEGVKVYGTMHELFPIAGRYTVTQEQLFYQFNIMLKYATVVPIALLFILTTDPSEFAASLNRIGVSYKIAYAVALAMRYIPDIQRDYENISFSAQARGIDTSRKEKLFKRLKNVVSILMPLVLASVERIEVISAAMELRGFGRRKRRTWYSARPFTGRDYTALGFILVVAAAAIAITIGNGSRFYNPFV
ncbi:energy-coupling factor transporter transmembrane protein EcfT [Paenibacillus sp. NEAU-GSW1]|uniref:energy-coupling factor transporter transmembrane component T family protein n=1 Tax=Paenibacillus sp. NEAU-GSW1 TaxID=2682486 RepID=UPI0012E201B4|nr:energy-coupling factor transporter transmembrane component T [Paenibacillus sp. NEAU-GSW1]MUT64571.1 energy-coupling factor transporter transmembrane protein EcfT [Paenibacillus sp. NEAU-GSW1]